MPYLTYDEYKDLIGGEIEENHFNRLLSKSSPILDNVTSYFYVKNDITKDGEWRAGQFKRALCAQIEYFDELGATTYESINNTPQTFSAGRTSVSNTSRFNSSGANESKSLIAEEVYFYLQGTGLLFGGVGVL